MQQFCTYGSVRGALGNRRPYRDRSRRGSATQAKPPAPPPRVNSLRRRWGRHSACRDFYHGLIAGKSSHGVPTNREPKGAVRLPAETVELHERFITELLRVIQQDPAPDDHSLGYALSPDPKLRAIELSMREYALAHEDLLREVLASSSDANHRRIAALFTGYARRSPQQTAALIAAVRDPDEMVRNNASRALGVLVLAGGTAPPTAVFVRMLSSGTWTDRNKALMVLTSLVERSDSELLSDIRRRALDAITEMSQWQCPDHSADARKILARLSPHSPY